MEGEDEIEAGVADAAAKFHGLRKARPGFVGLALRIALDGIDEDAQPDGVEARIAQQQDWVFLLVLHEIARACRFIFRDPAYICADKERAGPRASLSWGRQRWSSKQGQRCEAKRGTAGKGSHARSSN